MSEDQIMSLMIEEFERKAALADFALLRFIDDKISYIFFEDEAALDKAMNGLLVGDICLAIYPDKNKVMQFDYNGSDFTCSGFISDKKAKINYLNNDTWGKKSLPLKIDWELLAQEKARIIGDLKKQAA